MKIETANYPWVFWIHIKWWNWRGVNWYRIRGANYVEYQVWKFSISIGQPWFVGSINANQRDYGSAKYIHQTNLGNLKRPFSIKMKPPKLSTGQ